MRAFDLDGTLFDTFAATKAAYEEAGVENYTAMHFRRPAREWQHSPEIAERKRQLYPKFMKLVKEGWAMEYFDPNTCIVLTGASEGTVNTLRAHFNLVINCPFGYGLSPAAKARALSLLCRIQEDNTYYDDDVSMADRLLHIPNLKLDLRSQL